MKRKYVILLALFVLILFIASGCRDNPNSEKEKAKDKEREEAAQCAQCGAMAYEACMADDACGQNCCVEEGETSNVPSENLVDNGQNQPIVTQTSGLIDGQISPADDDSYIQFTNSIVSTSFDFIQSSDEDAFSCIEYDGFEQKEMPQSPSQGDLLQDAFVFTAYFTDGTSVELHVDNRFGSQAAATTEAGKYTSRLGKLPTDLRQGVERVVVHQGDGTASSDQGLIILFSENADVRISNNDLEETIFHESVHSSLDVLHADTVAWTNAQDADGKFITRYAENNPTQEDLAESAIFAYVLTYYPNRFDSEIVTKIERTIPNRLAYLEQVFPASQPLMRSVGPTHTCST